MVEGVPFVSSGATSTAHYALVRRIEAVGDRQLADQRLRVEVDSIRRHLSAPGLSSAKCRGYLIQLLYCAMSFAASFSKGLFNFALPHALNLAETGQTEHEKRTGYLFCAELMPSDHELQLMLVNTLRKDLESPSIPRVCLALDSLISSPTEDVIPAVQSRLHDLLSFNSEHVRRRSLLAFRALSRYRPELLTRITKEVKLRLKDSHPMVNFAALAIANATIFGTARQEFGPIVHDLLISTWTASRLSVRRTRLLRLLQSLHGLDIALGNVHFLIDLIQSASSNRDPTLLYACFLLLSQLSSQSLMAVEESSAPSLARTLCFLLPSQEPNKQYAFVSCLELLDPVLWAGTTEQRPGVFVEQEVERIMQWLDSPDPAIRGKTLRILHRIEPEIIHSYYSQAICAVPATMSLGHRTQYVIRLLQVIDVAISDDGEAYAERLRSVLLAFDDTQHVLEGVVEVVLRYIRHANDNFRVACANNFLASVAQPSVNPGPTYMILVAALACEFPVGLTIPSVSLLQEMATRLSPCPAVVQDAVLLSMLRLALECDTIPPIVVEKVTQLKQTAPRYVRRRCQQFLIYSDRKDVLSAIVSDARSSSIPDFLQSLELRQPTSISDSEGTSRTPSLSPVPNSPSPSQRSALRYAAYDPPQPTRRLRRFPSPQRSASASSRSDRTSRGGAARSDSRDGRNHNKFSSTVTAGDLALVATEDDLELLPLARVGPPPLDSLMDDVASRMDLITLDTPFVFDSVESPLTNDESSFQTLWASLEGWNVRGWCSLSADLALSRLRAEGLHLKVIPADHPPFEGDLKISASRNDLGSEAASVLLRLKEEEDTSCLWWLRSSNGELRGVITKLLTDT